MERSGVLGNRRRFWIWKSTERPRRRTAMERYIGLDVHAASTTAAVISEKGKRLGSQVVETNGRALITCLQQIPGRRHVCLEEGTQATWLYELLKPHVEEIVVLAVTESRGQKNDEIDAFGLAERLRIGAGT